MGFFKFAFKYGRAYLVYYLITMPLLNVMTYCLLPSTSSGEFFAWLPISFCVAVTAFYTFFIFRIIYKGYKMNKVLAEKGVCDEYIAMCREAYPKMKPIQHIELAFYLYVLKRYDEAESEFALVPIAKVKNPLVISYYCTVYAAIRINQDRWDEAQAIFTSFDSVATPYCKTHDNWISIRYFLRVALLYAHNGDLELAMACINNTDAAVSKDLKFAFSRNITLMVVYLMQDDYENADNIKTMTLRDLEEYDGFEIKGNKEILLVNIDDTIKHFDKRAKEIKE